VSQESGTGKKRLNDDALKVGDIILSTSRGGISKTIRTVTRSDVSHAMVYVEHCSVIDATAEGVQARNTRRLFLEDECRVHAMRLREGLSDAQLQAVCTFVRGRIGTQYSSREAMQTALGGASQWSKKQFCSRLVAQAFASAGVLLVEDPNFCSPEDLKASRLLVEVGDATVPVTPGEAEAFERLADVPQVMRDATNVVLDGARSRNKRIQNFDDIDRHLYEHPEDDDFMCRLLEKSGYLSVWRIEMQNNPWQYDLDLMGTAPAADIEEYCRAVLANEYPGPNRYAVNRGGYVLFARETGLHFFHLMAQLYEHLAMLHRTRVETATRWLENNQRIVVAPEPYLRPHTPEWFAALEVWDPAMAAMIREAIELAGGPDACSVCADDPARVYRLESGQRPPGGVDTLRLCDDCLEIRRYNGEPFVLLPDGEER